MKPLTRKEALTAAGRRVRDTLEFQTKELHTKLRRNAWTITNLANEQRVIKAELRKNYDLLKAIGGSNANG